MQATLTTTARPTPQLRHAGGGSSNTNVRAAFSLSQQLARQHSPLQSNKTHYCSQKLRCQHYRQQPGVELHPQQRRALQVHAMARRKGSHRSVVMTSLLIAQPEEVARVRKQCEELQTWAAKLQVQCTLSRVMFVNLCALSKTNSAVGCYLSRFKYPLWHAAACAA